MRPKKVGIVSRCEAGDVQMVKEIMDEIGDAVKIVLDPRTATKVGKRESTPIANMDVDVLITVGGDGTILRALQLLSKPTPILGIDMGKIGFLADVSAKSAKDIIKKVLDGFEVEQRTRLAVSVNEEELPPATNEAVIVTSRPAKMLHFRVLVDEKELETTRADGLVLATPTGSTAYAMSAGGPIVDRKIDAFVVVPLAPFKLSARPWVVPADSEIRVELLKAGKEALLVVDGQYTQKITKKDVIRFTKAKTPALFVKTDRGFYAKVRDKLVV
ncbi:MAG: NAD(+)/NADH kinase [Methanocellales archaeon]|nr:NAD(+)/NADH kinase [Methanocellales archaeon]